MFNFLVACGANSWDALIFKYPKCRVTREYTAPELVERYQDLTADAIEELKSFPALFITENEESDSRFGYITDIRESGSEVTIKYRFDSTLPPLPSGKIDNLTICLQIGRFELGRTHWAVKDENLFDVMFERGILTKEQIEQSEFAKKQPQPTSTHVANTLAVPKSNNVFIVHGQDDALRLDVERFVDSIGLKPIVLQDQPSLGQTIIEKFERYADVSCAIVLYTPCDIGAKSAQLPTMRFRARQNVVFEHGFMIGRLGRSRVICLVKDADNGIELPNDISGVVYIRRDNAETWQKKLFAELSAAGFQVAMPTPSTPF